MNATEKNWLGTVQSASARAKRKPDVTYFSVGMFVAFFAETTQGEEAWRELAAKSDGTAKFLPGQVAGVVSQLRAAGYVVAQSKPKPMSDAELDRAFAELDAALGL